MEQKKKTKRNNFGEKSNDLLWNMDCSNSFSAEHLLFATHKLLQEVYGHVIIWWQVHAVVASEEVVNLTLASVLGGELL